jgi:NAD(P)-dependent dehydrogenase (short-subunit alcohol dehydrogenase family)
MARFDAKVAVVTGGASGIGKATAVQIAREGGKVLIVDMSEQGDQLASALRADGLEVFFQSADVSVEQQVVEVVRSAQSRWGRLDVMVANAGISGRGSAEETSLSDWERVMSVNLTGVFLCAKHAIPAMRAAGGGAIVSTASVIGLVGTQGAVPYSAAKGAVVNMTRSMALDCAKDRIRVNAVCPGFIAAATSGMRRDGQYRTDHLISLHPLGRLGEPEDVAHAIAFLASDDAAFITGTFLVVDGGYTAQ